MASYQPGQIGPYTAPLGVNLDRMSGALIGVHVGDALGATYEFQPWEEIRSAHPNGIPRDILGGGPFGWSPGHATDDTDMTRAVLKAYVLAQTGWTSRQVAVAAGAMMLKWLDGDWPGRTLNSQPVDVGNATRLGLLVFRSTGSPQLSGAGQDQAGNGSLMRCIPSGLFAPIRTNMPINSVLRYRDLIIESALISAITHNDWRCILSCVAYNIMVSLMIYGSGPREAAGIALVALKDPAMLAILTEVFLPNPRPLDAATTVVRIIEEAGRARDLVCEAIENGCGMDLRLAAELGPANMPNGPAILPGHGSGYVLESLTIAVSAIMDTSRSFEDLLIDVVTIGRDTDTNAAIAGGLIGARDGCNAIPATWKTPLQFGDEFLQLIRTIYRL